MPSYSHICSNLPAVCVNSRSVTRRDRTDMLTYPNAGLLMYISLMTHYVLTINQVNFIALMFCFLKLT